MPLKTPMSPDAESARFHATRDGADARERSIVFASVFLAAAAIALGTVIYVRSELPSSKPLVFSPLQVLASSWYRYKIAYIESETFRTIDRQRNDVTTSEGQSYAMLRAVWQADQETFDGAWRWTKQNLQHSKDNLFAWMWGKRPDGTMGVIANVNGQNSASDADTDIALALILAYARWQDPAYLDEARLIITDIWDKEVLIIGGKPYIAANDVEKTSRSAWSIVNPSYFNPAAYRLFASVDPEHAWEELRSNSYAVLNASIDHALNASSSAALPPDWILVNKSTSEISAVSNAGHESNFGFDALRVPFRLALDAQWFNSPEAVQTLQRLSFLSDVWERDRRLASTYSHDGSIASPSESPAMYGGTLGYFLVADPEAAVAIYREKILSLYDPTIGTWSTPLSYYAENWVWFGIALYNRQLHNLAADLPATAFRE